MFNWLRYIQRVLFFVLLLALFSLVVFVNRNRFADLALESKWVPVCCKRVISRLGQRPKVVIFIHGTVGTTVSLLEIGKVSQDQVEGSAYKAVIGRMRNNPLFWKDQLVMARGLVFLNKYFDKTGNVIQGHGQDFLAAPVMANAFVKVARLTGDAGKIMTFAFGWSGLLSQSRRRREAVRFYNALGKQLAHLEAVHGIFDPEVIILGFSHGGSLALNLAGVRNACQGWPEADIASKCPETVKAFDQIIAKLPKSTGLSSVDLKGDYMPVEHKFTVHKLILLGCPVQPEHSYFAKSKLFERVLNLYSEQDSVQMADYFSSSETRCVRAFSQLDESFFDNVVDAQLTNGALNLDSNVLYEPSKEQKKMSWWQAFFGMKDISRHSVDPTHKEFWFFCFDKSETVDFDANPLRPLPVLVFVPMLFKALDKPGRAIMINFAYAGAGDVCVREYGKESKEGKVLGRLDSLAVIGLKKVDKFRHSAEETNKIQDFVKSLVHFWKKIQQQG